MCNIVRMVMIMSIHLPSCKHFAGHRQWAYLWHTGELSTLPHTTVYWATPVLIYQVVVAYFFCAQGILPFIQWHFISIASSSQVFDGWYMLFIESKVLFELHCIGHISPPSLSLLLQGRNIVNSHQTTRFAHKFYYFGLPITWHRLLVF